MERVSPAAAADTWSFGCLISYVGTGQPPYSAAVHERPTSFVSTIDWYDILEWAQQQGESPLERLRGATEY